MAPAEASSSERPSTTPEPDLAHLATRPEVLHAVRALSVDAVTAEVLSAFQAAGIPSILLKGPSIARWLYPSGGRSYCDTDLLIRDGDFPAADAVLRRLGFADTSDGWAHAEHVPHEVGRTYKRPGGAVDLHRSLHHIPVTPAVVWDTFRAHTRTLVVGNVEATVLDTTALALHVVLHAVQHANANHTAEDLRRAVAALPAGQWTEVAALAAVLGVEDELALGLRLDPAGQEVARALGLSDPAAEASSAWPSFAPRGAVSLDVLAAAPTLGAKLQRARWILLPSPARVRYESRSTGRALPSAYLSWWAALARKAAPALRYAVRRRRRLRQGR
jgi:hypothetical protein